MQPPFFGRKIIPLFIVFIIVNSMVLYFQQKLEHLKIDPLVVFTANCLLFVLSTLSLAMHTKTADKKNPNAAIRSVMAVTFIKLMVLAASAIIYLLVAGEKRSVYGVFVGMLLYIIYTFLEVRIAIKQHTK